MGNKAYYEVLDEIAKARAEYGRAMGKQNGAHNALVLANDNYKAATEAVVESEQRLNALELKLRAVMSGDTTTVIDVPPPRAVDPEDIGRPS